MRHNERSVLARFNVDRRGNVAAIFAMMSVVLCGSIAAGIDAGRAHHVQRNMQAATDAAALAAAVATSATLAERTQIAQKYFNSNNGGSFGAEPQLSVEVDSAAGTVTVTANSNVQMTFMSLLGIDRIPVSTTSQVGAGDGSHGKQLEVSMMIDLTGSMGATRNGMTKIDALKLASADLIDTLFPNNAPTSSTTRVAIAPMADYVNAGPYAAAVTGLDALGPYNNLTNLKSTKHGPFSGSHAGSVTGGAIGSQHGATSVASPTAGATYDNGHCANPNAPGTPVSQATHNDYPSVPVGANVTGTGAAPSQLMAAGSTGFYKSNALDNSSGAGFDWEFFSGSASDGVMGQGGGDSSLITGASNYYIPVPASVPGVTFMTDAGTGKLIGVPAFVSDSGNTFQPQIKSASAAGGYIAITGFSNGSFTLASSATSTGYFIPVPIAMMAGGGTLPQCTGTNNPNSGHLVSCVTERANALHRTDDDAPGSGDFLGPYNQSVSGSSNKLNYSEDGKCMTAGRELPAVIPLTNQRATLESFFASATIGGSTPGHLGHAWAWYMLSPKWNSLWPSESHAAEYSDKGVIKAAIIMTDGEYNTQYTNAASKAQALELCEGMREAGIEVFTIGFGFSNSAADTAAANTLKQCVDNQAGKYFIAYDADALRQTFKSIAQQLTGKQSKLVVTK